MRRLGPAITLGLFVAAAQLVFAQHVQTDFDHHADFSRYRQYSWIGVKTQNPLWDTRIRDAVDEHLRMKGWTPVENGGDAMVAAMGTTQTQRRLETFYDGFGGGWGWRRFGGGIGTATTTEQDYKEGTLIVDVFDARTKQLVWRGTAEDTVSDKPEKNEKKLNESVDKLFKDFPPSRPRN